MLRGLRTIAFRRPLAVAGPRAVLSAVPRRFFAEEAAAPTGPPEFIDLTFVDRTGERLAAKAQVGDSLWDVAFKNDIPLNLDMSCDHGGNHPDLYGIGPQCDWCHVLIPKSYHQLCGPQTWKEEELLEESYFSNENSRLGCQITVSKEMDGMVIGLPPRQEWYSEDFPTRMM